MNQEAALLAWIGTDGGQTVDHTGGRLSHVGALAAGSTLFDRRSTASPRARDLLHHRHHGSHAV